MKHRARPASFPVLLCAGAALLLPPACTPEEEAVPLSGVSAFTLMRKDRTRAPQTDISSVMQLVDIQIGREAGAAKPGDSDIEPAVPVANMMQKTTKAKLRLDPKNRFIRPDVADFLAHQSSAEKLQKLGKPEDLNVAALQHDEYLIPRAKDIPVRNQGQRGSCAAFAGIGHLEYFALKAHPGLRTLDLSEQRFYYMSRPDCLPGGCVTDEEGGSWYGDGYDASMGRSSPPSDNVPLEADCPYNPNPGRNELQVPQLPSCARGAAKVRSVRTITGLQELVDVLERDGLPVLWASPLSDNWFENRGLVTYRAAGDPGSVMHAGGHAYLIVGYKKLPNLPDEGGMCFMVKNSWGTGWGANGYTCQTLKWMREWVFRDGGRKVWLEHPVITGLELRSDLRDGNLPDNDEAEDGSPPDVPDEELDDGDAGGGNGPQPGPEPSDEDWSDVPLYGPNDSYYEAQLVRGSSGAMIRVALKGTTGYSRALSLYYEAGSNGRYLEYDGDRVGELRDEEGDLLLCTDRFSMICSLRLNPDDSSLYIEFPYPGNRGIRDGEIPDGSWLSLLTGLFLGYDVQVHNPKDASWFLDNPKAFVRLERPDGSKTQPLRMTRDKDTKVKVMGSPVGSIADLELCSGEFENACSFLSADERFWVLPGW